MSWDIVSKAVETVIANALFGITRLGPMLPLSPGPDTDGQGPEHGGGDVSPAPAGSSRQPPFLHHGSVPELNRATVLEYAIWKVRYIGPGVKSTSE